MYNANEIPHEFLFETPRLRIRVFSPLDLEPLSEMLADPAVMEFSVNGVMNEERSQEFLHYCTTLHAERGIAPWAIEEKEQCRFIGFAGLTPEERNGREFIELGYRLRQDAWGNGYATEAALGVLAYGFEYLQLPEIRCVVLPEHQASIRVAEKVGFESFDELEVNKMFVRCYQLTSSEFVEISRRISAT